MILIAFIVAAFLIYWVATPYTPADWQGIRRDAEHNATLVDRPWARWMILRMAAFAGWMGRE